MKYVIKILFTLSFITQIIVAQQLNDNGRVALIMADEESFLFKENEKQILEQITAWELMLMDNKIKYDVITVDEIDNINPDNYNILIISTDLYLDENEWNSLKEYSSEIGKLLLTSSIQVHDDDIKLTNQEAILKLTGIVPVSAAIKSNKNFNQVINSQTQLTQGIEIGSRILLSGNHEILFTDNLINHQRNLGYLEYSNEDSNREQDQHSAIVYGNNEQTKFIWFGFDHTDIIGGETDHNSFSKLLLNSIDWLKGKQYIGIAQWSEGINSAFIFSPIINGRIDSAEKLISILSEVKLNADFLVTENAVKDTALLKKLSPYGNYGLIINDLEKNSNRVFDLLSALKQNTGKEIEYLATDNMASVQALKSKLIDAGIKVIILSNYQESKLPFYLDDENKILIVPASYIIVRGEKDLLSLNISEELYDNMYRDAVNYQIIDAAFCESGIEKGIRNYLSKINSIESEKNIFITNSGNVYDWYEKKSNLSIHIISADNINYEIELRNSNNVEVENLVFIISDSKIDTEPVLYENGKISDLNFVYDKSENQVKLFVDSLKPYDNRKVKISLNDNL